jgi:hypothetical protein
MIFFGEPKWSEADIDKYCRAGNSSNTKIGRWQDDRGKSVTFVVTVISLFIPIVVLAIQVAQCHIR